MTAARHGHAVVQTSAQADVDVLSEVIAEAFHDLSVSRWLIPDPDDRRARYPGYFRLHVQDAIKHGLVYTTPGRDAVALWFEGTGPAVPPDSYAGQLAAVTGPWLDRFLTFEYEQDTRHPAGVLHQYLAILAVRPDQQGCGTGTALLSAHHARLDAQGIPAYLEAASPGLRDHLYLRHGYTGTGTPIRLPDGSDMWPMWREARPPDGKQR